MHSLLCVEPTGQSAFTHTNLHIHFLAVLQNACTFVRYKVEVTINST